MISPHHKTPALVVACAVSVLILLAAPLIGLSTIPIADIFSLHMRTIDTDVFWKIRVPRVCLSFLAGMGLSVSGMTFQSLFRNPLATPYTLGVASGASLGAASYVQIGIPFVFLGVSGISLSAFAGALLAIFFVYSLTRLKGGLSTTTMLLAGVAMSFFFSSLMLFIQYMSDFTQSFRIIRWLMGGISTVGYGAVINMLPFILTGCVIILFLTQDLNLMMSGEDLAASRGVSIISSKKILFLATSLMVGGVVSVCGPIGFVGMMAPHFSRLIIGYDHRFLTPLSLLAGGIFLTVCDTIARVIMAPSELPVGVITALLGGPFFIWLLLTKSRDGGDI